MQNTVSNGTRLTALNCADAGLDVAWSDGKRSFFHYIWLRDNCRCDRCGDPAIGRRTLKLTDIDLECAARSASITADHELAIVWNDGHCTRFSGRWLHEHRYDDEARWDRLFRPTLWSQAVRDNPPTLPYAEVCNAEQTFLEMLTYLRDYGICFVQGAPAVAGTLKAIATKIGPPQESNFGRVQDLVVHHAKRSIANDVSGLKPHTDEPYRASPPGVLLFHCVETDTSGAGSSTFLDGFEIAETLRAEDPDGFKVLTRQPQAFRRFFNDDVDLIAEFPVISVDEFGRLNGVRINDRVASPLCISPQAVPVYYRALQALLRLAEDPQRMIRRKLQPGDIAVFDNHRILHGRFALTVTGRRWLQWIQVERGDLHSALRITADRLDVERDAATLLRGAYG